MNVLWEVGARFVDLRIGHLQSGEHVGAPRKINGELARAALRCGTYPVNAGDRGDLTPDEFYLLGRLKGARYAPRLNTDPKLSDHFEVSWRGADDTAERLPILSPASTDWPRDWPPPAPDGLSERAKEAWQVTLTCRPFGLELSREELNLWIAIQDELIRPPSRDGVPISAAAARKGQLKLSRQGAALSDRLGGSPAARRRIGERHERERTGWRGE